MSLTHLDICSGIGAASIAFHNEGFETIGFSEIDPFCCRLLAARFPGIKNYGDLRNVPAVKCNVVSAGFPCQPVSNAGLKLGEADNRWIWPTVRDLVERCRPDFFLGENVVGITNLLLAKCQDDLESIGYQSQAFDIPSCAIGLPSVERHVWIVAAREQIGLQGRSEAQSQKRDEQRAVFCQRWQVQSEIEGGRIGRLLSPSRNLRSCKGVADYVDRISAIGNAFPPQICQIFARAIAVSYQNES